MKQTKISTRLIFGFALILLCAMVAAMIGLRSINQLSEMTSDLYDHTFVVADTVVDIRSDVLEAQNIMNNMETAGSRSEFVLQQQKLQRLRELADKHLATVRKLYPGNLSDVDELEKAFAEWREARGEGVALMQAGKVGEAIAFNDRRVDSLAASVLKRVEAIRSVTANQAVELRRRADQNAATTTMQTYVASIIIFIAFILVTLLITRSVQRSLRHAADAVQKLIEGSGNKVRVAEAIGAGDLSQELAVSEPVKIDQASLPDDEIGILIRTAAQLSEVQYTLDEAFRKMTRSLRQDREIVRALDWLKSGQNNLNSLMRGEQGVEQMANKVLAYLAEYLKAGVGALYRYDDQSDRLCLTATYAFTPRDNMRSCFRLGEGLVGQAAREQKIISLSDVPRDYLSINSALGESTPQVITVVPLVHGTRLIGVLEIGSFHEFADIEREFIQAAGEAIAIGLDTTIARQRTAELLEETQQQAEELRVQQEELQQSNEELEERAHMLEQQREKIRITNQEIAEANDKLRQKAADLNRASDYKSEFLANMSHELRTPLNSLMILSNLLAQNKDGNLSAKQVEFANTIYGAGRDLLNLISDILDISKVEAGQMRIHYAEMSVRGLCDDLCDLFAAVAEQKGLDLRMEIATGTTPLFQGDEQRVQQILKNLMSNALKFTQAGEVVIRVTSQQVGPGNPLPVPAIAFSVCDTGIGVPADKRELIFQAFYQADGSISRKYGGTGLGLSISLQLARAMHGEIRMSSEEGKGSLFTLYLPLAQTVAQSDERANTYTRVIESGDIIVPSPTVESAYFEAPLPDDRERLTAGDRSILIIEDDLDFAKILQDMIAIRGFSVLLASNGESGVALADRYVPSAIILDVSLPHVDGWRVMRSLKDNPHTRHIPVHFITCMEDRQKALSMGAIGFVTKPVSAEQLDSVLLAIESSIDQSVKRLLIVEDNTAEARSMVALLEAERVEITVAASGREALELLSSGTFDCMVLDLNLTDMSGFDLLERIEAMKGPAQMPVIVHSGRELAHEDERRLRRYAESIIIKGTRSPERLLNEVSLFLHLVESNLHPEKQRMIRTALDKEAMLDGRKVLLVDDDMRNIFSLSSILAEKNMHVIEAENGAEALARLDEHPDVAIVLMDIMMPEMDGYTAMREIRNDGRFGDLPIIAMTAKALRGDHEKCIEAGASDYIAKPVEVEKLFSLLRVWTFQQ